ncbi:hypothetical protein [Aeromicrobium sp. P5_D10]
MQSLIDLARTPTAAEVLDLHWTRMDELEVEGPPVDRSSAATEDLGAA